MNNPFVYSSTVEGESFCNRKQELSELTEFCLTSKNVLVYAHRRYGKTSLIKVLSNKLKKNRPGIKIFYIDLYGTLDEKDFIEAIFSSFAQAETKIERLANTMKVLFSNSKPKLSYNPDTGNIEVEASYNPEEKKLVFNEVIDSLSKYSTKTKTLVVFDEFQEIGSYGDESIKNASERSFSTIKMSAIFLWEASATCLNRCSRKTAGHFTKWPNRTRWPDRLRALSYLDKGTLSQIQENSADR